MIEQNFQYNYLDSIKNSDLNSKYPHQVEFQPGKGCGLYACPFCYGINQKRIVGPMLPLEKYEKLLDDIKGKVPLVTIAGINSEPLMYPDISGIFKRINKNGLNFGINTKGYMFNDEIIESMLTNVKSGSFITFSLDSSDIFFYNKIHGIKPGMWPLDRVYNNMKKIYDIKIKNNLDINITASCLLFEGNKSREQMENFVNKFGPYTTRIRFSFPQTPNYSTDIPSFYTNDEKMVDENIEYLKNKYPQYKIHFLKFSSNVHNTNFHHCYAQRFLFVVDYCGNVYPCPQVASKQYKHLIIGNLQSQSFEEIINSDKRKNQFNKPMQNMSCKVCDRKDEEINTYFNKVTKNE